MSVAVSIVYITHRTEPRFAWFADGLALQLDQTPVEVVLVDGLHTVDRQAAFEAAAADRFLLRCVPAKPTPYNGPRRLTQAEYFAAASARNTGAVYASHPYLVFVDDLSLPLPGWWAAVVSAAGEQRVVAGAYEKHRRIHVEKGVLVSSRCSEPDSRWSIGDDGRPVQVGGGALYGCSFGLPRSLFVELNGLDELCDASMGEDAQLGYRLENAGVPIWYDRRVLTIESEEGHRQPPSLARRLVSLHPAVYMARLREYGVLKRSAEGPFDNVRMALDIVRGTGTTRSVGNYYDLVELTERRLSDLAAAFPRYHWFDQLPLQAL